MNNYSNIDISRSSFSEIPPYVKITTILTYSLWNRILKQKNYEWIYGKYGLIIQHKAIIYFQKLNKITGAIQWLRHIWVRSAKQKKIYKLWQPLDVSADPCSLLPAPPNISLKFVLFPPSFWFIKSNKDFALKLEMYVIFTYKMSFNF